MAAAVAVAHDAGRIVAVHAVTAQGMARAIAAGVDTIEHGDEGTADLFRAMHDKAIAYCPTLSAVDAIAHYRGWDGAAPAPAGVTQSIHAFHLAMAAGTPICVGGDVGVFAHGTNAREIEQMAAAGMAPALVLIAATSGNARFFPSGGSARRGASGSAGGPDRGDGRSNTGRVRRSARGHGDEGRRNRRAHDQARCSP